MKRILTALSIIFMVGCASSNTQYYEAVQKTAEANARAAQAKFDALSAIATSGDGQAASAAVMALALTNTSNVQPIPQQSEAIQWASILASPVTSLGMMWMQADSAKTMARYSSQVDIARVAAESKDNQALYGAFVDTAAAGYTALGNVDYTPFVDGMVTLGTAGIDGAVTLGTAGFDSNVQLGTAGINGVVDMGTVGVNGLVNVANTGYDTMLTLGQGHDTLVSTIWNKPQIVCSVSAEGVITCN